MLTALQAHCTKAIFFPIGLHATYEPGILKQVAAAGHAIGSHTWCHQDLSKTKGKCQVAGKTEAVEYDPKDEIEKGISAVRWAVGGPTAPYFRFPALRQPPELIDYLGKRNIGIFSTDLDSFDFKMRKPEQVRQSVMAKLKKHGKGIVLLHDFQHATAEAAMDLLNDLKAGGYKVVFMKPKFPVTTIASYDEQILKHGEGPRRRRRPPDLERRAHDRRVAASPPQGAVFSSGRMLTLRTAPPVRRGSQNGVAPVIISARSRPVAGPRVNPQWAWP